jgi:hypothetical protein
MPSIEAQNRPKPWRKQFISFILARQLGLLVPEGMLNFNDNLEPFRIHLFKDLSGVELQPVGFESLELMQTHDSR